MHIEPEISKCSIVLLGRFNPAIFHPSWFARWGIVSDKIADEAEVTYVLPQVAAFKLGAIDIRVEEAKFSIETAEAPWITISDFVLKTFSEHLAYTPMTKVGINRSVHFRVGSEEIRNCIGRALAPTKPWGKWGERIDSHEHPLRSGLIGLVMHEPWDIDEYSGHNRAQVAPSNLIEKNAGISVSVNREAAHKSPKDGDGSENLMKFLHSQFDASIREADWIIGQLMLLQKEFA